MKMKIALLGKGKTGIQIKKLADMRTDLVVTVFDRNFTPAPDRLAGHDVVISFFPGEAFVRYIPALMDSGLPVVTGSTGFEWPGGRTAFSRNLADRGIAWIHGNNFSLGMNLVHAMIGILRNAGQLFENYRFDLHEVHHTAKLDAPSGTALAWQEWVGEKISITSERTGDVTGIHTLNLSTPFERISITHEALDRTLFASGAIWAAEQLLDPDNGAHSGINPGLNDFQSVAGNQLVTSANNKERHL
jgi:4-hydroxy-tetrahydrodipicolinate reductase